MSDPARREFRAWVKANHPDRGGDPEAFAAGLERMRRRPGGDAAPILVHRRRRGVARWVAGSLRRHRWRRERAGRVR
ncbi:MAG: hypothetical protein GEV11_12595 [Streptosporangiales bacterium]|nr:hypothetical protein [Streptosporangiales bacterium]